MCAEPGGSPQTPAPSTRVAVTRHGDPGPPAADAAGNVVGTGPHTGACPQLTESPGSPVPPTAPGSCRPRALGRRGDGGWVGGPRPAPEA